MPQDSITVFLCSTYRDLLEERAAVLSAIGALQLQHESMEHFGARPDRPIETCLDEVSRSDVLVVLVGHLYGTIVPKRNISFTEAEYVQACRLGKKCLVYFRDENVPVLRKYVERDSDKQRLLDHFRETLGTRHTVDTFSNAQDLGAKVKEALAATVTSVTRQADARSEYLALIKEGADAWNKRRHEVSDSHVTKTGDHERHTIDLSGADLRPADLRGFDLSEVTLSGADLADGDLTNADLKRADLGGARLVGANLTRARLKEANLADANLTRADLREADFQGANLSFARLVETNFEGARLRDCVVYGVSAWRITANQSIQSDLVISPAHEPAITVDDIEVAPFISLLLESGKVRNLVGTISTKSVLVLGRFTQERKVTAEAIRAELRGRSFMPMFFDLDRPSESDFKETIMILALISVFIIVDITDPRTSPLELNFILPNYSIPTVPIIQRGELPFPMFADLQRKYPWVLPTIAYDSVNNLVAAFDQAIVLPALKNRDELALKKSPILKGQV